MQSGIYNWDNIVIAPRTRSTSPLLPPSPPSLTLTSAVRYLAQLLTTPKPDLTTLSHDLIHTITTGIKMENPNNDDTVSSAPAIMAALFKSQGYKVIDYSKLENLADTILYVGK